MLAYRFNLVFPIKWHSQMIAMASLVLKTFAPFFLYVRFPVLFKKMLRIPTGLFCICLHLL